MKRDMLTDVSKARGLRLLLVADGGSPIARSWISRLCTLGIEVHLVSSRSGSENDLPVASIHCLPLVFSGLSDVRTLHDGRRTSPRRRWFAWTRAQLDRFAGVANELRNWVG